MIADKKCQKPLFLRFLTPLPAQIDRLGQHTLKCREVRILTKQHPPAHRMVKHVIRTSRHIHTNRSTHDRSLPLNPSTHN